MAGLDDAHHQSGQPAAPARSTHTCILLPPVLRTNRQTDRLHLEQTNSQANQFHMDPPPINWFARRSIVCVGGWLLDGARARGLPAPALGLCSCSCPLQLAGNAAVRG